MTDKAKLEEIKKLADAMYYAAQHLTTDASRLHKAMEEYHQFIIHEWREEPVSDELEEASKNHAVERFRTTRDEFLAEKCKWSFRAGAQWQEEQIMSKAVDALVHTFDNGYIRVGTQLLANNKYGLKVGDRVKVIIVKKED